MGIKVVYFSRKGYSAEVAARISAAAGGELVKLTDDGRWQGILGFLRAGKAAAQGQMSVIRLEGAVGPDDTVVAVAPLWAGRIIPAMRTFLAARPPKSVHYVVTSNGSTLKERDHLASVTDIVRSRGDAEAQIGALVKGL